MKNIVLLGAPGTGKGTQAENISKWYGIPHISTGDIFRANIKEDTEIGREAKGYIDKGKLVPDDVTIGLVMARLAEPDCAGGFILDGFPRSVNQAVTLDGHLESANRNLRAVVNIFVPDEVIVQRLSGRRLCGKCQKPYHTLYNPPAAEGVCDDCGGAVVQRDDDKEETIRKRLSVYYRQTEPLLERYEELGLLVRVVGSEQIDDTTSDTREALRKVFDE